MDLGATICLPKKYECVQCPVNKSCIAKKRNKVELIPYKKKKTQKRKTEYNFLVIRFQDEFLLEQRENEGIWPGLWSFPALRVDEEINSWMKSNTGINKFDSQNHMESFVHSLTHLDITIHPIIIDIGGAKFESLKENMRFIKAKNINTIGTSKAVKKIIDRL